ncbi:MAG TPA: type I-U CRISPR-associated RAMP protein Csb1/Cas7u [Acidimicrobiales bacterium]|nr:type I-U CRISPR-associated RAMP protein Csb1/Cas7u [Acidimicrobiales bacterium]
MASISYEELKDAVGGASPGIRLRTSLEPLGGRGDKIFPPTYVPEGRAETKYAIETRRVDGQDKLCALVDSVASQANRQELVLLGAYRSGRLGLPVISVDFREAEGLEDLGLISDLEASHRVFDAILRDSLHDGLLFRHGAVGRAITEATPRNATALFRHAPTTLLFGGWDSTGPKGGRGAKYERAITSEIVAVGIQTGKKTASRIDPLGIERQATIYEGVDGEWTLSEEEAVKDDKGRPKAYSRSGTGDAGRPSQVNHGNIAPSIDDEAGGVTADDVIATTVLSFIALRKLGFPAGTSANGSDPIVREVAARTAIAALGLAAVALSVEEGFDLRSRCVLVPTELPRFELLRRDGGDPVPFELSGDAALDLVRESAGRASELGLGWVEEELLLVPTERLAELVRRSRNLTATNGGDD